jgi:fatty-acyl-CoA synthase
MGLFDALARESTYIAAITRTLIGMRSVKPDSQHTIVDIAEERAKPVPHAIAFYYLDSTMSYAALNFAAGRRHWAQETNVGRGEAVALVMENRPDYVATWLGLLKAGVIAALINTNLRGAALAHSIALAGARHAIVGAELADVYLDAVPQIAPRPIGWCHGGAVGWRDRRCAGIIPDTMADHFGARASPVRTRILHLHVRHAGLPRRRTPRICACFS